MKEANVDFELSWEEVKSKLDKEEEYLAFDSDSERIRVYKVSENDYLLQSNGLKDLGQWPFRLRSIKINYYYLNYL